MPQYMLLLRNEPFPTDLSPEEMQAIFLRYREWMQTMKTVGGQKLKDGEGRIVRANGSGVQVTDGRFAEAKEILGGFFIIEAATYDHAIAMASKGPHLDYGSIEVRAVAGM